MKKMKRFFVGMLALLLVVVMMPAQTMMTVQADTTIDDPDATGSLKLYKYEVDSSYSNTTPGTGETTAKPEGATALKDVGFTLYYVSDLEDYYKGTDKSLPTQKPSVNEKSGYNVVKVDDEEELFTNASGLVEWENLPLGIYYVEETTTPQNVITDPVWFYVSIPMTSVDGDEWLYDVVVYPKNTTTYAGLTLKKTGNGTAIDGAKFVLQYKEKSTDADWKYVAIPEEEGEEYSYTATTYDTQLDITVPTSGFTFSGLRKGYYRFIEVSAPAGYIMDGKTIYAFEVKDDGTIAYASNQGLSEYEAGTGDNGGIITIDNQKPTVEKEVLKKGKDGTDANDWGDAADYSVGEPVPFKITATVPENIGSLTHYILTDNMSTGLTLETNENVNVKYYAEDAEVTGTNLPSTATKNATGWNLDLSTHVSTLANNNVDKIVVTFNATLNANAVTAGNGNPNDIYLEYTNNIIPDTDTDGNPTDPDNPNNGEKEETTTITDRAVVYTFGIQLVKTFEGGDVSTLSATFDLYRTAATDEVNATTIKYGDDDVTVVKVGTYTTDETGKITIDTTQSDNADNAFSVGDYYFVETKTANGYNLLKSPIQAKIAVTYTPTITTTTITKKYNADGSVVTDSTVTTGSLDTTTTFTPAMGTDNPTIAVTTEVVNNKGFTLPVTGGVGMFGFIIVGVSMMIAAVVLFITSKKKEAVNK